MEKRDGIGKVIRREAIRAVLERSQGMKLDSDGPKDQIRYDNVEEILDVPYMNHEGTPLAMDIFKPVVPEKTELPVMVIIHGGGLTLGDRRISRPFGRILAHKGYLTFSVEYRLAPRASVPQELDDVCAGINKVGEMLVDYNVDFNRIFMAAESAGAFLAVYVAAMNRSPRLQETVGYSASRINFRAIGLNCGMLYTNGNDPMGWILSDQIYGDRRDDEAFLELMNPEHPEILENLPPTFLSTSQGDFLNNYSFMMDEAMKKAKKEHRFLYYADPELKHAFLTMQPDHPKTMDCIEKMLAWFEEQAEKQMRERKEQKKDPKLAAVEERLASGKINDQFIWKYVTERNSVSRKRLDSTALIDCTREYTYREMFGEWKKYARVFSALKMTGSGKTRAAIVGAVTAEPMFCFYGLNMTGATVSMYSYPDFLPGGMWKEMLKKEKITDLILSDIMVTPTFWREIRKEAKKLKLRNVLLVHSLMGGPTVGPAELVFDEFNYHALRHMEDGPVFLGDLIEKYADEKIVYGRYSKDRIALITHTSGTTKGTRKPLPYLDSSVNQVATDIKDTFHRYCGVASENRQLRVALPFDYSSFLCFAGEGNSFFANGETVVLTFFGFLHPKFVRAAKYYRLDIMFTSGFIIDKWMLREDLPEDAFSTVRMFACGGTYLPPDKLQAYTDYLHAHGYKGYISRGYGMSETGGAQLSVPPGNMDDILGFPCPKEDFLVYSEEDGKYYSADDAGKTGTMFIASGSRCLNELDGEKLFDYTVIDGRNFICTNDQVRVNEDGSFTYVGRADHYFVNNEGLKFLSGIVDKALNSRPEIESCAIVPIFDKRIHDTLPVLYCVPAKEGEEGREAAGHALARAYIEEDLFERTALPAQFVFVDRIPMNSNGKLDIYRITRDRLTGDAYNILPVMENGKLADVRLEKAEQVNSAEAGTLPGGNDTRSAMGMFDLFNAPPPKKEEKKRKREMTPEQKAELSRIMLHVMGALYGMRHDEKDIDR